MKRLDFSGSSRVSLSNISSSLGAKNKTNTWLKSKSKVLDSFDTQMNDSNCPNKTSKTYASARRLTVDPATFDHYSFKKSSGVKKTILVCDLDKTFNPSTNPIHGATFSNFQVNLLTSLLAMRLKLLDLILNKLSGDTQKWSEWSDQFVSTVCGFAVDDNVKMKYLKFLVSGKPRAIEGMGYNRTMYPIDWKKLSKEFGRPELVENAQPWKNSLWCQFEANF